MKHKILVADDSLTIQKVIKITLASEPFDLVECTSASDLPSLIKETMPNIILLDFNLSEDKTGYDLAREIKSVLPKAKILMLFGTFDTIDENLLEESGVNHKIIKPFDGTKFINLCRVMADEIVLADSEELSLEEDFENEEFPQPISLDEEVQETEDRNSIDEEPMHATEAEELWVVEGSQSFDEEVDEDVDDSKQDEVLSHNPLVDHMKDWGMDIPGVIGGTFPEPISDVPEVISQVQVSEAVESQDNILPSSTDLEYPDLIDLDNQDELLELETSSPALRSIEPFSEVDSPLEITSGGTDTDEALTALKAELEDELEDKIEPTEELWGADIVEKTDNIESDFPQIESHRLHQVVDNTEIDESSITHVDEEESFEELQRGETPSDFPADVMEEFVATPAAQTYKAPQIENDSDLELTLKERLTPVVEELVKEYCRESVERIAWEIIPDLAENLIKKEIQRISDSIIDS